MITIGEILHEARIGKKLTLEQAEQATKIRLKFLDALEKDELAKLPSGIVTKGFVKNYAAFLGLSVEESMAFYRRQVNEERTKVVPESRGNTGVPKFRLTPQIFTFVSISFLLLLFFAYLVFSYFRFAGAPVLTVDQPANNVVVKNDRIRVKGRIDPDSSLLINGQPVAISEAGTFLVNVPLSPGLNVLNLVATNKFKRQTTIVRNVRLEQ